MSQTLQQIYINHLNYAIDAEKPLFSDLILTLGNEKTGLIGRNGAGKTSLIRLVMGELVPDAGTIQQVGTIAYCPQRCIFSPQDVVADFTTSRPHLAMFGLSHLPLSTSVTQLSGGELTRLNLAKAFASEADYFIFDEPTNNLDREGRELLYSLIRRTQKGFLIVSHDRTLLNLMDQIIELSAANTQLYGGNYDHYYQQKNLQQEALEHDILVAKLALNKSRSSAQRSRERNEQKASVGRKQFKTGKIDKMFARAQQGRSEKTHGQQTRKAENVITDAENKLATAKSKREVNKKIIVDLPGTYVPNSKVMLDIQKLSFGYESGKLLFDDFDLLVTGPQHVAITGANGSGKTTLIKLILGELPTPSPIYIGTPHVRYLSQTTHLLDPDTLLIENFLLLNPDANRNAAHAVLAQFLFRNRCALKLVKNLSGGEKLRAELACILMAKEPPQLLILDEPTNHLDLDSIESIESALANFQGTMLLISHDQHFLNNVGIDTTVEI